MIFRRLLCISSGIKRLVSCPLISNDAPSVLHNPKSRYLQQPGFNFLIPVKNQALYVHTLNPIKKVALDIPTESAVTSDGVSLNIESVLYLRLLDLSKVTAAPHYFISAIELANKTLRSELGKMTFHSVLEDHDFINRAVVGAINEVSSSWGIDCQRYEIRDVKPENTSEAMKIQAKSEKKKNFILLELEENNQKKCIFGPDPVKFWAGYTPVLEDKTSITPEYISYLKHHLGTFKESIDGLSDFIENRKKSVQRGGNLDPDLIEWKIYERYYVEAHRSLTEVFDVISSIENVDLLFNSSEKFSEIQNKLKPAYKRLMEIDEKLSKMEDIGQFCQNLIWTKDFI